MVKFNIAYITTNDHYPIYAEFIHAVGVSIFELGYPISVNYNHLQGGAINVLIGSTLFAARYLKLAEKLRGQPYIVYQLEQLHESKGLLREWPEYWELLQNARWIWDYAPASTKYLRAHGLSRVTYVPPSYHPSLERFRPRESPEFDVVFFGSPHPRRAHIIDALRMAGVKVAYISSLYGERRDQILAAAKFVLNIHAWEGLDILESMRLSYLLANRCFVVSEKSDHNPYDNGLVYADYDALAATCLDYLGRSPEIRAMVAERGYQQLRAIEMKTLLRPVLADCIR